ncbi:MAG: Sec-independent protein translocase protein TatB [Xanthomonadales bacterium]|nr:Sec-independent protein translocase protein TatB [Xanthomonadales bacterium]
MFDVGFAELLLLSLIALLVLGPERLPRIARTIGGLSRKARSSWLSLKRSIDEEIRKQDLKEPMDKVRKDFRSTVDDFKSSVDDVKSTVGKAGQPFADIRSAAQAQSAAKPEDQPENQSGSDPEKKSEAQDDNGDER